MAANVCRGRRECGPPTGRAIPGTHLNGFSTDENGGLEDITRSDSSHAWAAGGIISTATDQALNRLLAAEFCAP